MKVFFPYCNPIQFRKVGVFENYDDAMQFEEAPEFKQPFFLSDRIQFIVNWSDLFAISHNISLDVVVNNLRINLINQEVNDQGSGGVFYSSYYKQEYQSKSILSGYYIFSEVISNIKKDGNLLIKEYDEFYFIFTLLGTEYISNKMELISCIDETKLLQYGIVSDQRSKPVQNIYFDTLFSALFTPFEIRIPAIFLTPEYNSNTELFDSYTRNVELISSVPFENVTLEIGKNQGIPDWFIKNLNFIFHCKGKKIDGVDYELTPETSFEVQKIPGYNLRFLNILMSPKKNKYSYLHEVSNILPTVHEVVLYRNGRERRMINTLSLKGSGNWTINDKKDGTLLKVNISQLKGIDEATVDIETPLNFTENDIEHTIVIQNGTNEIEVKVIVPVNKSGIGYWKIEENFVVS